MRKCLRCFTEASFFRIANVKVSNQNAHTCGAHGPMRMDGVQSRPKLSKRGVHEQANLRAQGDQVVSADTCDLMLKDTTAPKQPLANECSGSICINVTFNKCPQHVSLRVNSRQGAQELNFPMGFLKTHSIRGIAQTLKAMVLSFSRAHFFSPKNISYSMMRYAGQMVECEHRCQHQVACGPPRGARAPRHQRGPAVLGSDLLHTERVIRCQEHGRRCTLQDVATQRQDTGKNRRTVRNTVHCFP